MIQVALTCCSGSTDICDALAACVADSRNRVVTIVVSDPFKYEAKALKWRRTS